MGLRLQISSQFGGEGTQPTLPVGSLHLQSQDGDDGGGVDGMESPTNPFISPKQKSKKRTELNRSIYILIPGWNGYTAQNIVKGTKTFKKN